MDENTPNIKGYLIPHNNYLKFGGDKWKSAQRFWDDYPHS